MELGAKNEGQLSGCFNNPPIISLSTSLLVVTQHTYTADLGNFINLSDITLAPSRLPVPTKFPLLPSSSSMTRSVSNSFTDPGRIRNQVA